MEVENTEEIFLPSPKTKGNISLEEAILKRRSVRDYKNEPLTLEEISQILWSAQGITAPQWGGRSVPSAGALYPLEIFLVVKNVENLRAGVYRYLPEGHKLIKILEGDISEALSKAALGQDSVEKGAINLVITAIFERTTKKYSERGIRYVYMEAGHSAQNVYLQVQTMGLGTVTVGAFDDQKVKKILKLSQEEPLYIMPIGRVK